VSLIRYDCVGSDAGMRKAPDGAWVRHCNIEAKLREARVEGMRAALDACSDFTLVWAHECRDAIRALIEKETRQ